MPKVPPDSGHGVTPVAERGKSRFAALGAKLRTVKGAIVAVAGIGAVVGGLAGYWNAYVAMRAGNVERVISTVGKGDAGPLSIVVLPFKNQMGDASQAYFADGLTDALIADLARIQRAFVVSPATSFSYRDKSISLKQVAAELGVRFALTGSVYREGTLIRVTASLADTSTSEQLWTETFEGSQANLFVLQDSVTTRIGNSIGREAVVAAARLSHSRAESPQAIDLVLRARASFLTQSVSAASLTQSMQLYREALKLDANNVDAMVGLAHLLAVAADNGFTKDLALREAQFEEARQLATQAKTHAPNDSRIYSVLASYAANHRDFAGAIRNDEAALLLDPRNPILYSNLADDHLRMANPKRAVELLTQAIQIDPRRPDQSVLNNMGRAHFMLGESGHATEWLTKAIDADPGPPDAHVYLAAAYARKGDQKLARAAAREVMRKDPSFKLSLFETPAERYSADYQAFREGVLLPACRLAGLID